MRPCLMRSASPFSDVQVRDKADKDASERRFERDPTARLMYPCIPRTIILDTATPMMLHLASI